LWIEPEKKPNVEIWSEFGSSIYKTQDKDQREVIDSSVHYNQIAAKLNDASFGTNKWTP
jgi:hypothetical protein